MNESLEVHDNDLTAVDVLRRGRDLEWVNMPCRKFRRDLSGKSFDSCVCGRSKAEHDRKELTRGASEELTSKLNARSPPRTSTREKKTPMTQDYPEGPFVTYDGGSGDDDDDDQEHDFLFCGSPAPLLSCSGFFTFASPEPPTSRGSVGS